MRLESRLGTDGETRNLVPAQSATMDAVRALVRALDPDGVEVASPRERAVWWAVKGARMKDGYAYAMPHGRHVNLGFFRGVHLPDPERLLTGTGKVLRHVKLRAPDEAARPAIAALLRAAIAERRAAVLAD